MTDNLTIKCCMNCKYHLRELEDPSGSWGSVNNYYARYEEKKENKLERLRNEFWKWDKHGGETLAVFRFMQQKIKESLNRLVCHTGQDNASLAIYKHDLENEFDWIL